MSYYTLYGVKQIIKCLNKWRGLGYIYIYIYIYIYSLGILQLLWLALWIGRIQENEEKSKIQSS